MSSCGAHTAAEVWHSPLLYSPLSILLQNTSVQDVPFAVKTSLCLEMMQNCPVKNIFEVRNNFPLAVSKPATCAVYLTLINLINVSVLGYFSSF